MAVTFTRRQNSRGEHVEVVTLDGVTIGWIAFERTMGLFQFYEAGDESHSTMQNSDVEHLKERIRAKHERGA